MSNEIQANDKPLQSEEEQQKKESENVDKEEDNEKKNEEDNQNKESEEGENVKKDNDNQNQQSEEGENEKKDNDNQNQQSEEGENEKKDEDNQNQQSEEGENEKKDEDNQNQQSEEGENEKKDNNNQNQQSEEDEDETKDEDNQNKQSEEEQLEKDLGGDLDVSDDLKLLTNISPKEIIQSITDALPDDIQNSSQSKSEEEQKTNEQETPKDNDSTNAENEKPQEAKAENHNQENDDEYEYEEEDNNGIDPNSPFNITEIPVSQQFTYRSYGQSSATVQIKQSSSNSSMNDIPSYPTEELDTAYKDFQKKGVLPQYLMRDSVVEYAKGLSLQYLIEEKYNDANNNEKWLFKLLEAMRKDTGGFNNDNDARYIEERMKTIQNHKTTKNQQFLQRINNEKERAKKLIESLEQKHVHEQEDYERSVTAPEFIQTFSKPSEKLLELRRIQKKLALSHEFQQARQVKAEADLLEVQETRLAELRIAKSIKNRYQVLLSHQQQEIYCAKMNSERKLQKIALEMEEEANAHSKLKKQLEIRMTETKRKKAAVLPPLNVNYGVGVSPNDRRKLREYRKSPDFGKLPLQVNGIQKLLQQTNKAKNNKTK